MKIDWSKLGDWFILSGIDMFTYIIHLYIPNARSWKTHGFVSKFKAYRYNINAGISVSKF